MRKIFLLVALIMLVLLCSCAGNDPTEKDKIPPTTPKLITHLGDTGDDPITIDGALVNLNDDNNGIDAVSDGNWIKVPWEKFVDNDLSHVGLSLYRIQS